MIRNLKSKIARLLQTYSRRKKYTLFRSLLADDPQTILDVASGPGEFLQRFAQEQGDDAPFLSRIIALDLRYEYLEQLRNQVRLVKLVQADATRLPFLDNSVDLICSNAFLEHVPADVQANAMNEIERVGRAYWVSTPSRRSLIEVHYQLPFIGWLKPDVRDRVVRSLGRELHNDPIHLLTFRQLCRLAPGAEHHVLSIFGLFEHLIAVKKCRD